MDELITKLVKINHGFKPFEEEAVKIIDSHSMIDCNRFNYFFRPLFLVIFSSAFKTSSIELKLGLSGFKTAINSSKPPTTISSFRKEE